MLKSYFSFRYPSIKKHLITCFLNYTFAFADAEYL